MKRGVLTCLFAVFLCAQGAQQFMSNPERFGLNTQDVAELARLNAIATFVNIAEPLFQCRAIIDQCVKDIKDLDRRAAEARIRGGNPAMILQRLEQEKQQIYRQHEDAREVMLTKCEDAKPIPSALAKTYGYSHNDASIARDLLLKMFGAARMSCSIPVASGSAAPGRSRVEPVAPPVPQEPAIDEAMLCVTEAMTPYRSYGILGEVDQRDRHDQSGIFGRVMSPPPPHEFRESGLYYACRGGLSGTHKSAAEFYDRAKFTTDRFTQQSNDAKKNSTGMPPHWAALLKPEWNGWVRVAHVLQIVQVRTACESGKREPSSADRITMLDEQFSRLEQDESAKKAVKPLTASALKACAVQ